MNARTIIAILMMMAAQSMQGMVEQNYKQPVPMVNTLINNDAQGPLEEYITRCVLHISQAMKKAVSHNRAQAVSKNEFLKKLEVNQDNKEASVKHKFIANYVNLRKKIYGELSISEPSTFGHIGAKEIQNIQNLNMDIEAEEQWDLIIKRVNPPASKCTIL